MLSSASTSVQTVLRFWAEANTKKKTRNKEQRKELCQPETLFICLVSSREKSLFNLLFSMLFILAIRCRRSSSRRRRRKCANVISFRGKLIIRTRPWLKVDSARLPSVSIQFQLRNQSAFITSRRKGGRDRQKERKRVGRINKIFMLI